MMGIAGLSHIPAFQALTQLIISPTGNLTKEFSVTAMILPHITCDLPLYSVSFSPRWMHLSDNTLANPDFGHPEKIDLFFGIDIFTQILRHGWRCSPPGSPSAFETEFGWVLAGEVNHSLPHSSHLSIVAHHTATTHGDDILWHFWKRPLQVINHLSPQKKTLLLNISDNVIHIRLKVISLCHSPKGLLPQHLVNLELRR